MLKAIFLQLICYTFTVGLRFFNSSHIPVTKMSTCVSFTVICIGRQCARSHGTICRMNYVNKKLEKQGQINIRFMVPLTTEQGHKVGDIRDGPSFKLPYCPYIDTSTTTSACIVIPLSGMVDFF